MAHERGRRESLYLAPSAVRFAAIFLGDGFWRSGVERSLWPDLVEEGLLGRDGESAGLADAADDLQVARPELVAGRFVSDGDMTGRVHANR